MSDYHLLFYFFKQTSNSKKLTCGFYIIGYCNYNELTKNPNIEYQFPDDHTREDLRCQPFSDYLEPKTCNPYIGDKKRTPGTAILVISGTEMLKNDGLS